MRLRTVLMLAALAVAFTMVVQAAEVEGILMDKMCSSKALKDGMKAAQAHTRECALMEDCAKSGYGVYTTDGKFISFDAGGNKKALAALKAHKGKDNLRVKVTGDVTGETMKVTAVKLL